MTNTKEVEFRNKVSWYNFILCMLVVCIHSQNMYIFTNNVPWINTIITFFIERIAICAVAGFFLCSSFLFYRNLTWKNMIEKLKRRINTLVIPFLMWNLIYYLIHFTARKIPYLGGLFGCQIPLNIQEILHSIFLYKYNPVFWFMMYLIIFSYLSPLIYLLLKQKWVGLFIVIVTCYLSFTSALAPFIHPKILDLFNWSICYLVGAYSGLHLQNVCMTKQKKFALFSSFLVAIVCFYFAFIVENSAWIMSYRIFGAMVIWYLLWILNIPKVQHWMQNTFFIYAIHQIVALFLNKIGCIVLGTSMYAGGIVFLLIPLFILLLSNVFERISSRFFPHIWSILSGGRTKKIQTI